MTVDTNTVNETRGKGGARGARISVRHCHILINQPLDERGLEAGVVEREECIATCDMSDGRRNARSTD
eukprot:6701192-Prymnesium_polylepis.1